MSTSIRPEISDKNEYWIERQRYYELKHFCLQYPIWKKAYTALDGYASRSASITDGTDQSGMSNRTERAVESRLYFRDRMELVEKAAMEASPEFGSYILESVTEGLSYETMRAKHRIPCCKETYYDIYRRFFWLLSKARN